MIGLRHTGKNFLLRFIIVIAGVIVPVVAKAQPITPEIRLDAIFASINAIHLGAGATVAAGNYVSAGIVAGAGVSTDGRRSGRLDVIARFQLDPFRESRWAPYAGGGLTTRFDQRENAHTYLMIMLGIDGPVARGAAMAIEGALGGGGRVGIILRRARAARR